MSFTLTGSQVSSKTLREKNYLPIGFDQAEVFYPPFHVRKKKLITSTVYCLLPLRVVLVNQPLLERTFFVYLP